MTDREILDQLDVAPRAEAPAKDDMFDVLSARIAQLLDANMEQLFSILYRMDVSEAAVKAVMHPAAPEPPHIGLTRVVLARQAERNRTMREVKAPPIPDLDEELRW